MARNARRNMKRGDATHRVANPERHQAMLGLRSSNAAQPHQDRRTRRVRTRNAQKTQAIALSY